MTEQSTAPTASAFIPVRRFVPRASTPAATPAAALPGARARARAARVAEQRLSRLRLYSYSLTLASCVLALMSFMYVVQGSADGDRSTAGLGVLFVLLTLTALWGAVRVTHLGEGRR